MIKRWKTKPKYLKKMMKLSGCDEQTADQLIQGKVVLDCIPMETAAHEYRSRMIVERYPDMNNWDERYKARQEKYCDQYEIDAEPWSADLCYALIKRGKTDEEIARVLALKNTGIIRHLREQWEKNSDQIERLYNLYQYK